MQARVLAAAVRFVSIVFILSVFLTSSGSAQQATHIQFSFQGCRNNGTIILPINGSFICPDTAYTPGDLKGWHELDLVPFRLTTSSGNQKDVSTAYNVAIAAAFTTNHGFPGYDVISVPTVNPASDASCSVGAGPTQILPSGPTTFPNSVNVGILRLLTVNQAPGTTCVFDYYQRLAIGSGQNPGASLHAFIFEQPPDFANHDSDIPIQDVPVGQSINKTMTAVQNTDHTWTIQKTAPANVRFANTCDPNQPASQPVNIQVTWTKMAADPFSITVTTVISATNPASRAITINITDKLYSGTDQANLLDTASTSAGGVVLQPNQTTAVLTHVFTVPNSGNPPAAFNDVATATYSDPVTGIPITQTTTATASTGSPFGGGAVFDNSALISDSESINGTGLLFSVDAFNGVSGAFDSYTAGTQTAGPVLWNAVSQSDSGSVTFNKTVFVTAPPAQTTGTLTDTATLTGSDFSVTGFQTSASATVNITADALVTLVINKNVDHALTSGSQTFTFHVKDAKGNEVATPTITFGPGDTSNSASVPGLHPGVTYTVSEDPATGWTTDNDQNAVINLPACSGSVVFNNKRKGQNLTVSKTASTSFTRQYNWSINKSVDKTSVNTAPNSSPSFNYSVVVAETGVTDSNWQVTGAITVTNPNDWEDFTGVSVSDLLDNNGSCTVNGGNNVVTVAASQSVSLPYTCTFSSAPSPGSGTNTATATWDANSFFTLGSSAQGTAGFAFGEPTTTVNKTVTVVDSLQGNLGTVTATYDTGILASQTFTYTRSVTPKAGTCVVQPNTATIQETNQSSSQSVQVCSGADLSVSKTATTAFNRQYNWSISKAVDRTLADTVSGGSATFNYTVIANQTGVTDSGWQVTGNITVNNPNDWEDVTTSVSDTLDAGSNGSCVIAGGGSVTIPRGGSQTVAYTCTFSSAPAPASGVNTASANWDKNAFFTANSSAAGTAKYAFTAPTTTSNQKVTITDTFNGASNPLGNLTATDPPAAGASATFQYARTVTAPVASCATFNNTARIVETGQTSSQSVQVCGGSDLSVSKTATASFNSSIVKSVDRTLVEQAGGTSTFNYTVKVTESGWTITGNIVVSNPNNWEDFTGVNVADALNMGGNTCVVAGGNNVTVPRSSSVALPYSCTFLSAPSANNGINTATATWNPVAFFTADGSASGTAAFAFNPLTVTDTFNNVTNTLGTVTVPPGMATFTYSRTVNNALGGTCKSYPNTAQIVQTGQSSSQTVTVCNTQTGALTIGFWQNKNGQGIITGSASTGGVCNAATWLRQFAPFQDLSATASCSATASYAMNIIKAANASGSAMNAMLKAQMLATALDVYFSDPALGGNKIGAATPLGGVNINLTQVCNMVDNSGGSGTCSGTSLNVSSAFGGATHLTVMNMLLFQNSVSSPGGGTWYGNLKSVQELAKDAFDAINNQAALIAP